MSEYDSLKIISHPPFNRWVGLPVISGTIRVSQVLVRFSSYMPRPVDTGRPFGISPCSVPGQALQRNYRFHRVGFRRVKNVTICIITFNGAVPCFRRAHSLPVAYMILCVRFVWVVQRYVYPSQSRNTQYGWLAKPYPTGTLTLQEAPSFAWRANRYVSTIYRNIYILLMPF